MTPRRDRYDGNDTQPGLDGDAAFTGMNMALNPMLLTAGQYAFGRNVRTQYGHPTTRRGMQLMAWAQAENAEPVWASLSFRDPYDSAYVMKARTSCCEICDPTGGLHTIAYPEGVTLDSECELVQCFDRVVLFRGEAHTALVWAPPSDWEDPYGTPFAAIAQSVAGDGSGADPIPNGAYGYVFKNRLIVPFGRDQIAASDVLDYTRYAPVQQQFRINAGTEESVRGVVKGGRDTLVVFKDQSVHVLENFTSDLSAVTQDVLPIDVGLGARRSIVSYGQDILFMGPDLSVYTLQQALDNRLQGDVKSFSAAIEPLIDSIKATLAHKCVARIWNKCLYVAVPLSDAATSANAILVYDFGVGGWVSCDTSGLYEIQNLLVHPYEGKMRLFLVHEGGNVYLLEEGYEDVGPDGAEPIPVEFISRGYFCGSDGQKKFLSGEVVLSTWAPEYTIESSVDGGNQ